MTTITVDLTTELLTAINDRVRYESRKRMAQLSRSAWIRETLAKAVKGD